HTSHAMQPLDVGVFKTFKSNWNGTLQRALLAGSTISRYSFGKLFNETWLASAKRDNVVGAFESTGIHPFNDQKIQKYVLVGPTVFREFDNCSMWKATVQRVKESLKTSTPKRSSCIFREKTVLNQTSKRLPRVEFDSNKPCTSTQAKAASENENECCVCGSPYAQSTVDWLQCLECLRWACEDCYASSSCANCAV
ncbi:MAG: hypothetical protein AAGK05_18115, partial [Pseudomonadota bacterium]